jgi:hypothetical protein
MKSILVQRVRQIRDRFETDKSTPRDGDGMRPWVVTFAVILAMTTYSAPAAAQVELLPWLCVDGLCTPRAVPCPAHWCEMIDQQQLEINDLG